MSLRCFQKKASRQELGKLLRMVKTKVQKPREKEDRSTIHSVSGAPTVKEMQPKAH